MVYVQVCKKKKSHKSGLRENKKEKNLNRETRNKKDKVKISNTVSCIGVLLAIRPVIVATVLNVVESVCF